MAQPLVCVIGPIARITLRNPPANVLSRACLEEIERSWDEVSAAPEVRVVLLTGAGRFFCAGADIRELSDLNDPAEARAFSRRGQAQTERLPVDRADHLQRHQRMRGEGLEQLAVGERAAAAGDRGAQDLALRSSLADQQRERLGRRLEAEAVLRVHGNERRHVEILAAALRDRVLILPRGDRQRD